MWLCFSPQLLGLAAIAFGIFLPVINHDLDYVTGSHLFSGALVIITAGVAIVIVAAFGVAASWSEVWQLLAFVSMHVSRRFLVCVDC